MTRFGFDRRPGRVLDRSRLQRVVPLLSVTLFVVALGVLYFQVRAYRYGAIVRAVGNYSPATLALAAAFAGVSYAVMTGYDALAFRYLGASRPYRETALPAFVAFVVGNTTGYAVLVGGSIRYRLYTALGVSPGTIARVVVFAHLCPWVGYTALTGVTLLVVPASFGLGVGVPPLSLRAVGLLLSALPAGYLAIAARQRRPLEIRGREVSIPPLPIASAQLGLSALQWTAAATVLYLLLPAGSELSFPGFLAIYLFAVLLGLLSRVPGGLGVFEASVLALVPGSLAGPAVVAALVAYRAIYYLVPLSVAGAALGLKTLFARRSDAARAVRVVDAWAPRVVADVVAALVVVAGATLLVTGALPTGADRLALLAALLPLSVIEASHFLASVVGAALVVLGRGLQRRVRAALYLTVGLLALGTVLSLAQGFAYETAAFELVVLGVLVAARRAFYRESLLTEVRLTPGWIATVAGVFFASVWLGALAYGDIRYTNDLWWRASLGGDPSRFLRASAGVAAFLALLGLLFLLRPVSPPPVSPTPADLADARRIAARSPNVDAYLALLGDKSLLFDDDREAFVMYRLSGRSWVAMGGPIGAFEKRRDLAWAFRELVARYGGRPVIYEASAADLPLILDLGLTPYKLGEQARVPLADFTLEGSARKKLRYAYRRAKREGCSFEVLPREAIPDVLPELRRISAEWIAAKGAREIGFSLGYFDETYLREFPIAVVRVEGEIVAFANVLEGGGEVLSIDLMRYSTDAPPRVMEYLFIELMLYGTQEGYDSFDLGMAPLSGLENRPLAPLWNRLGTVMFRHGEHFYNYRGLRSYKEKFDPVWEPRYLACRGRTALPLVLVDVAALVSGRRRPGTNGRSRAKQKSRIGRRSGGERTDNRPRTTVPADRTDPPDRSFSTRRDEPSSGDAER